MASVKKCDWCGAVGTIRFELKEPSNMSYMHKELCSTACVTSMAQSMEPDILETERKAATLLGRIKRWI